MTTFVSMIVTGAERALGLGELLLKDIPDDRFARFAPGADGPIEANHPAFIYGHLAIYPTRILAAAGMDGSAIAPPERFLEVFEAGRTCVDDPDGSVYPERGAIVDLFVRAHRTAIDAVAGLTDDQLKAKHTIEGRMAEAFPTVGHVASFLLVGHTMMHLGQMSTWRRAIGLGSAM